MPPNSEKQYDFKPIEFDVEELRVIPDEGKWMSEITKVKLGKSKADEYPQIIVEFTMKEALEEQEQGEGTTAADWITFFPKGDSKGDFPREKLRQLLDACGIDRDTVPKRITSKEDFDPLLEALDGAKLAVWIAHKDRDGGDTMANVNYKAKGSKGGGKPVVDDDEETPKIKKGGADKKSAKSKRN